jgi:hypothetical protein
VNAVRRRIAITAQPFVFAVYLIRNIGQAIVLGGDALDLRLKLCDPGSGNCGQRRELGRLD